MSNIFEKVYIVPKLRKVRPDKSQPVPVDPYKLPLSEFRYPVPTVWPILEIHKGLPPEKGINPKAVSRPFIPAELILSVRLFNPAHRSQALYLPYGQDLKEWRTQNRGRHRDRRNGRRE